MLVVKSQCAVFFHICSYDIRSGINGSSQFLCAGFQFDTCVKQLRRFVVQRTEKAAYWLEDSLFVFFNSSNRTFLSFFSWSFSFFASLVSTLSTLFSSTVFSKSFVLFWRGVSFHLHYSLQIHCLLNPFFHLVCL